MVDIALVAKTVPCAPVLLKLAKGCLGRSLSKRLDELRLPTDTLSAFIVMLGELEQEGCNPAEVLREAGPLLRHASYSFAIRGSSTLLHELAITSDLKILGDSEFAVVSGNLEEWRTAIINGSTGRELYEIAQFYTRVLSLFEIDGLGQLWANYQKVSGSDSVIKLSPK